MRGSRRQFNRGRRDSRVSDDSTGSVVAAAAAAAAAALSSSGIAKEGLITGKLVAEHVLGWLLQEAIAAAEPQLMLYAASQRVAASDALAKAARVCQGSKQGMLLKQQLQQIPLPPLLDLRIRRMAEYLSRKRVETVKACKFLTEFAFVHCSLPSKRKR